MQVNTVVTCLQRNYYCFFSFCNTKLIFMYITTTLVWEKQPISKLRNKEKTVGFVFLAAGTWCVFFPRPSLKPRSRILYPRGHSSPCWHATNLPFGPARCGPTQPQTALYVSDAEHFLGHASTTDCIYNKQRTKQMFVGCGGEKQTRQTVGWLHASLRSLCVTHFAGILLLEKLV